MTLSPEVQEILDRVKSGTSKYIWEEEPRKTRSTPRQQLHKAPTVSRGQANRERIVALYAEGKTSGEIRDEIGVSRQTVLKHLKAAGVWVATREGVGGRPLSEVCARGHDQAIHRAESNEGKGDWHCGKCKYERNQDYKKTTAARRMDNRIERGQTASVLVLEGRQVGFIGGDEETLKALDAKLLELSRPRCRWH